MAQKFDFILNIGADAEEIVKQVKDKFKEAEAFVENQVLTISNINIDDKGVFESFLNEIQDLAKNNSIKVDIDFTDFDKYQNNIGDILKTINLLNKIKTKRSNPDSYAYELKLEREINKLRIKNISASEQDIVANNVLIKQKEDLIKKERADRSAKGLENSDKESELINHKNRLAQELVTAQDAYNKKLAESTKYAGDVVDYMRLLKEESLKANLGLGEKIEVTQGKSDGSAVITFFKDLGKETEVTKIKVTDMIDVIDQLQNGNFDISKYKPDVSVITKATSTLKSQLDGIASVSEKADTFFNYLKNDDIDTAKYKKIADEIKNIINRQGEYAKSVNETTEETKELTDATQDFVSKFQKEIDDNKEKIAVSLSNKITRITSGKTYDDKTSSIIKDITDDITKLKNFDIIDVADIESARRLSEIIVKINNNINEVKNRSNDPMHILPEPEEVNKSIGKINGVLSGGFKIPRKLKQEFKELRDAYQKAFDGDGNVTKTKAELQKLNNVLSKLNAEFEATGKHKSIFGSFTSRITDMNAKFIAQYFSFQDILNYARQAYQYVAEIDKQMIELEKVSDMSASRLAQSFEHATVAAKDLGSTVSEVISATADWSRLGYGADEAERLAEVATIYKNVGDGIDIDTANNSLISTLQGFQMEASEAMKIVDAFNEVANKMPIDSAGIGAALQRSAAAFNSANTDLNESIALITATNAVVQDPERVGNMWKTVSMRIRGAKAELEDAGLETEGMVESTSELRGLVKSLTGFDIMVDDSNYKDIKEIIVGIGKEWDKLNDIDQAALLEKLAGKTQGNALAAALENWEMIEKAYAVAEKSSGSAMREQEKWEQGLEAEFASLYGNI